MQSNCFVAQLTFENVKGEPQTLWFETSLSINELHHKLIIDGCALVVKLMLDKAVDKKLYVRGRIPCIVGRAAVGTIMPMNRPREGAAVREIKAATA